jgi:hypothetical protein
MQPNPSNGFVNSKFMRSELQAIPTQRPVTQEKTVLGRGICLSQPRKICWRAARTWANWLNCRLFAPIGGHHSLNIPGPSVFLTPRHSSNAAAPVPPPTLDLHFPLPHQLHRIDNDSIRDKTVTMSTNNNTIINPDDPHLCSKQS